MARSTAKFNAPASPLVWADADKATARAKPALAAWRAAMARLAAAMASRDRTEGDMATDDIEDAADAVMAALCAPVAAYRSVGRPGLRGERPHLDSIAEALGGRHGEVTFATMTGAVPE